MILINNSPVLFLQYLFIFKPSGVGVYLMLNINLYGHVKFILRFCQIKKRQL